MGRARTRNNSMEAPYYETKAVKSPVIGEIKVVKGDFSSLPPKVQTYVAENVSQAKGIVLSCFQP